MQKKKKEEKEKSSVILLSKIIIVTILILVHNEKWRGFFLLSKSTAIHNGSLSKDNPIHEQLF